MAQQDAHIHGRADHQLLGCHLLDATPQETPHAHVVFDVSNPRLDRVLATLADLATRLRAHPPPDNAEIEPMHRTIGEKIDER